MNLRNHMLAALALTLAGCAATAPDRSSAIESASWVNYVCTDGQVVQATYPNSDTALVKIKGQTHSLHVAISGSGARYIGDGWQWWTKGMHDGMLAPLAPGESIASAPSATCHAN